MKEEVLFTIRIVQKDEALKDILQKYLDEGWAIESIDLIKPEQELETARYGTTDYFKYRQKIERLTIKENEKELRKAGLWSNRKLNNRFKKFKEEKENA